MTLRALHLALVVASVLVSPDVGAQEPLRRFDIEDIFQMEALSGPYAFSPDGALMAFVRQRAIDTEVGSASIFANDRSDVWVYDAVQDTAINLTGGAVGGGDFWYPVWSPSGTRLAMVSTRGTEDGRARVWVWDRYRGALTAVGDRHIDIENDRLIHHRSNNLLWLSESMVAFPALPNSVPPLEGRTDRQAIRTLTAAWNEAIRGERPTASVLESGRVLRPDDFSRGETFVTCSVTGGECSEIIRSYVLPLDYLSFGGAVAIPAPTGSRAALLSVSSVQLPNPDRASPRYNTARYSLHLVDEDSELRYQGRKEINNVLPGSVRWSPDGHVVSFVASCDETLDVLPSGHLESPQAWQLFSVDPVSGELRVWSLDGLEMVPRVRSSYHPLYGTAWAPGHRLVVYATGTEGEKRETGWWLLDREGQPRNLTDGLETSPGQLYPAAAAADFVYSANGNLWGLSVDGIPRKLTGHPVGGELFVTWTDADASSGHPVAHVVYRLRSGETESLYHFDVGSGTSERLAQPPEDARFAGFTPALGLTAFVAEGRTGTRVWITSPASGAKVVLELNSFLRGIAEAEIEPFEYTSLDGETLTAWVLLPLGYEQGKQYPTVVWVYQGSVMNPAAPPHLGRIQTLSPLNLQALASHGYAVLFPSMPGPMHDYGRLLNGVMPAVDEVIARGIADPNRLAVMGQSNGGFSTYGLITLTHRFHAAIALAGLTDLFSISMQFPPGLDERQRLAYGVTGARLPFLEARMGLGLPWKDAGYLRNSPISYVDRVTTPVLMLHGDFDGVPIQQAEEFFTALQRLGKLGRFVRYLGDGHVFQSPANIRHSWAEIFSWLDTHFR